MKIIYGQGRPRSGVYKIRNICTKKHYIGSSKDILRHWYQHLYELRHGIHDNSNLQKAFDTFGESNFEINVITYCDNSIRLEREQYFIDRCFNRHAHLVYNISKFSTRSLPLHTKLTDLEVFKIKKLYKQGIMQKELAEQFSVNQATISRVVNK